MLRIVATFTLKEGTTEKFLETAQPLIDGSRNEPGCISYALFQDTKNPNDYAFLEEWEDQAAIDFHNQTEHFKTYGPKLNEYRVAPTQVAIYKLVK